MSEQYILGLDPGFASFGWALFVVGRAAPADYVAKVGVIRTKKSAKKRGIRATDDNLRRVHEITDTLVQLLATYEPVAIAAESFQHGAHKHTAVKVALAWGALGAVARCSRDTPILQCSPQEMKKSIAGIVSASKEELADSLRSRYTIDSHARRAKIPDGQLEHVFDAVGAAVACLDTDVVRMARRMGRAA